MIMRGKQQARMLAKNDTAICDTNTAGMRGSASFTSVIANCARRFF